MPRRPRVRGTRPNRKALARQRTFPKEIKMANAVVETFNEVMHGEPNLSWTERGISIAAGLGLAAAAAKPRPNMILNVLALAGGSYLAYRGAVGYCPVKAALEDNGLIGSDRQVADRRH